ncbi:PREDICTED: cyclin-A2 isoform X2 [Dinoponera quadriceps]|uniref:Cyclin-A2 n=1 Tax=Dinoponera quadriceps TaxID=609295 RepID=A0A6P3Y1A3_DINQU|nr:PREDICTED: cyclin-A2 isoform X2 [Dinoponera quadriceps]
MAAIRIHEDQENRIAADLRGRAKGINGTMAHAQAQAFQNRRAVLGVLNNNCAGNILPKPEVCKDDKYVKTKPVIPTQYESFKIYEDKKEEPVFKIYEDKLEEETSVVLRDSKEKKEMKTKQEAEVKLDREVVKVEENISESCIPAVFHDSMDISQKKNQNDKPYLSDNPMLCEELSYSNERRQEDHANRRNSREIDFFDMDEYRSDIYSYLREVEAMHRAKAGYMKKQPDITYAMRSILVEWLVEVVEEYRLQNDTLYLAVSYIDRFLSYMSVVRSKLQLVGAAAMFIAAKYEEIYAPDVGEFVYITDDTYTKKQVLRMENLILRVLAFDLSVPTPLTFLMDYCISNNLSDKIKFLAMYLCELSLLEADPYLQYLPSHLAASALALARHTMQEEVWPHELELSTGYDLKTLAECINNLNRTFCNAPNIQQQAIQEKYRSNKYGHVSLLLPRSTEAVSCEDVSEEDEEGNP